MIKYIKNNIGTYLSIERINIHVDIFPLFMSFS